MSDKSKQLYCLTEDITDKWIDWDRDQAIVLIDDKFYSSENHQYALEEYEKDYWEKMGYYIDEEGDMGEAIRHTDKLFQEGKIHGFDLFIDYETGNRYLISHYKRAFADKHVVELVSAYAKENHCQLATFLSDTKLSDDCALLELC